MKNELKLNEEQIRSVSTKIVDIEPLRNSGQKQVFKCTLDDNTRTILKFVHIESWDNGIKKTDKSALERLMREVNLINQINSPYLPQKGSISPGYLYLEDNTFYFYSEVLIEGDDLRNIISKGGFDTNKTEQLLIQITKAIDTLWQNGRTIHRDIKPENIIFDRTNDKFVLIDSGLALALFEASITPSGYSVGTLPYMSPEQIQGKRRTLDFRSDLYSLGITSYEMVTGLHPYWTPGMDERDLYSQILYSPHKPLLPQDVKVSEKAKTVIDKLLSKKPHARYNSCHKVLEALE